MKIVFIMGSYNAQRCMKRIDEFVDKGYDVDAYAFDRGIKPNKLPQKVIIQTIGSFSSSTKYLNRITTLIKGINSVIKKYNGEHVIFYVFGLANTSFVRFLSNQLYIYEESDLVHTYIKSKPITQLLEWWDKKIIAKSFLSVLTSEGFVRFHYGKCKPRNVWVIPNRLPLNTLDLQPIEKQKVTNRDLSIGFVGYIRYNSVFNFAKVIATKCPHVQFHFYGTFSNKNIEKKFQPLSQYDNIHFHGAFHHPMDLPKIYSEIDIVLSTYDINRLNVRYAEPNKIYEAIYFRTPIIVSSQTYLAEKVRELNIGYSINPLNDDEIVSFIEGLTIDSIQEKMNSLSQIPQNEAININDKFFEILAQAINKTPIV